MGLVIQELHYCLGLGLGQKHMAGMKSYCLFDFT